MKIYKLKSNSIQYSDCRNQILWQSEDQSHLQFVVGTCLFHLWCNSVRRRNLLHAWFANFSTGIKYLDWGMGKKKNDLMKLRVFDKFWTYGLYVMLMSRFISIEFIQWSIDHPVVQYWTAIKLESPRNPPSVFGGHSCKLSQSGDTRSRRMEGISFSNR